MNYGNIKTNDIANGTGIRTSVFVSGCRHHCKKCFQPETWDFDFGAHFTEEVLNEIIDSLRPDYVNGLTILGGEPMEPENQPMVLYLIKKVKEELPEKTIWVYSGYTFEELTNERNPRCHTEFTDKILENINVLVDGEFHIDEKNIMLSFRGSENQRIIDVQETLKEKTVVTLDLDRRIDHEAEEDMER